jgi:hypothetical protein
MHKARTGYNNCTARSGENICSLAAVEALRKRERQDETQFTPKIDGFFESLPP